MASSTGHKIEEPPSRWKKLRGSFKRGMMPTQSVSLARVASEQVHRIYRDSVAVKVLHQINVCHYCAALS